MKGKLKGLFFVVFDAKINTGEELEEITIPIKNIFVSILRNIMHSTLKNVERKQLNVDTESLV